MMRQSQQSNITSKSRSRSKTRSLSNSQVENKFYFCHYKNAMYMGGMKSFQRNGYGIIIHDSGASMFCQHYIDFKHGHNIIFYQNCLMSVVYDRNKIVECAVRLPNYMLFVRYNKESQIDGKAILFNYDKKQISYLVYKKGTLSSKKQQRDYSVINRVFDLQNLQFLIGIPHSKALRFQIEDNDLIACQKSATKFSLGFHKRGALNGLGFSLIHKDNSASYEGGANQQFVLKPLERGYFQNSQLTGMGEKWFKNGNYFVGEFKDNVFQGKGILKNSAKNNWVYGTFCKGNMAQLIEYSNQGDTIKFKRIVQLMHQRKSSWINKEIVLENPDIYEKQIEKILNNKILATAKTLNERKQQVLKKIQQNFICDDAHMPSPHLGNQNFMSAQSNRQKTYNRSNQGSKKKFNSVQNQQQNSFQSPNMQKKGKQRLYDIQQQNKGSKTVYKIKLLDLPKTGQKIENSPSAKKGSPSKLKHSQRSMGFSQIKDESPSFKLDSKRIIGRSRLFKYTPKQQEEEEPPKFNYVPVK